MSSSTSSSERGPSRARIMGGKVLLGLLVLAAALEIFTRTRLYGMSKDFRRFASYPARAEALTHAPGIRIALIGNSATDRGVDRDVVQRGLSEGVGRPVQAELFVADQSRINTWQFMLERYLFRPGPTPDLVVITFYEDDLEDGNAVEIGRLAQFFTTWRDWPSVFRVDLPALDDQVSFLVSSVWATFAASERIRERLLEALVPRFQAMTTEANLVTFRHRRRLASARAAAIPAAPPEGAYLVALDRLLARAQERGVRLAFVAYPTQSGGDRPIYGVRADVLRRLEEAGCPMIDLRRGTGLAASDYADEVHLNDHGKAIFSAALAKALSPVVGNLIR